MKSISKNTVFYMIYTVLNVLFPFITGIYVSRILLVNLIGEVDAARNIAQYFVILAYLGIPTYGLREISKVRNNKKDLNKVFSELLIINAVSTLIFLIAYLALVISVPLYRADLPLYLITGGSVALNFLNISWLYEGLEEFSFVCVRNLIFKIACFALLIIFVRKSDDYLIYAAISVIGVAGNYILNVAFSRKRAKFTFKELSFKRHLKPIMFLVAVNLAIEIYTLVDVTMLKILSGPESVAYYSYGSKIHKIFITVINAFTMVVVPRISFYFKENQKKQFNELISKTLVVILIVAFPLVIGTFFVSDFIIVFMYGDAFRNSSTVLKILSLTYIISPIGYLLGSRVLLASGKEKLMVVPVVIGAACNVVLNYFLIKQFNELGAAVASILSEIVVAVTYIILSSKSFKLTSYSLNIWKVIVSTAFMLFFLFVIHYFDKSTQWLKVIKEIIIGVSTYILILVVLRESTIKRYVGKYIPLT